MKTSVNGLYNKVQQLLFASEAEAKQGLIKILQDSGHPGVMLADIPSDVTIEVAALETLAECVSKVKGEIKLLMNDLEREHMARHCLRMGWMYTSYTLMLQLTKDKLSDVRDTVISCIEDMDLGAEKDRLLSRVAELLIKQTVAAVGQNLLMILMEPRNTMPNNVMHSHLIPHPMSMPNNAAQAVANIPFYRSSPAPEDKPEEKVEETK